MQHKFIRTMLMFAASVAVSVSAWAAGATRSEAQAQVAAAVAHAKKVGTEQAIKDFNAAPEWKAKGMNVVFNDMKGLVLASSLNERLVGKQTYEMKDPSGKEFVKDFTATAQKGEGWVDYQFVNPETKKLEERSMFVRKVAGFEGYVGVAITK
jgi:signal transduction histidine kinase